MVKVWGKPFILMRQVERRLFFVRTFSAYARGVALQLALAIFSCALDALWVMRFRNARPA